VLATASEVDFVVPDGLAPGAWAVTVVTPSNLTATGGTLTVETDKIALTNTDPVVSSVGDQITLLGSGFFAASALGVDLRPISASIGSASVDLVDSVNAANVVSCPVVVGPTTNSSLTCEIPQAAQVGVKYNVRLTRGGLVYNTPAKTVTIT